MVAKAKIAPGASKGKEPFLQQSDLKDVYPLFADRKTRLLPLNDVSYVLRACGLTIHGDEEAKIKSEVEKIDGLGKPISFSTLEGWWSENSKTYVRSYNDAYNALGTLCHEGIIGDKSYVVKLPHLRNLVSQVGDKIKPETFDKITKGEEGLKADTAPMDEFMQWLQK